MTPALFTGGHPNKVGHCRPTKACVFLDFKTQTSNLKRPQTGDSNTPKAWEWAKPDDCPHNPR